MKNVMDHLKSPFWLLIAVAVFGLSACRQKARQQDLDAPLLKASDMKKDTVKTDTVALAETAFFTYAMASELIQPGYKCDEKLIAKIFGDLGLSMELAEQYIVDADYGGNTPGIIYCWGEHVKFENFTLSSTGNPYFGVQFYFIFDDSHKTGSIKAFSIISSSEKWYQQFMKDAQADGMRAIGNVDPAIYGKKGKMYQKDAGDVEGSTEAACYYVYDFSSEDKFEVQVGFDNGIDI